MYTIVEAFISNTYWYMTLNDFEQASACLKHIQYIKFLLYTSQHSSVINKTMICMPECKIYLTSVKNVINYKI